MNDDFDFPLVPGGEEGSLQPYSPQAPLAPSPADTFDAPYWQPADNTPSFASPGHGGSVFGVPVQGASVREMQESFYKPIGQLFTKEMTSRGVPARYTQHAVNWLLNNAQRQPVREPQTHDYDVSGFIIAQEDRIPLTNFLNAMSDIGTPQNIVRLYMSFWWNALPKILEANMRQSQPPSFSTGGAASLDNLSEADYSYVMKHQAKHQQATQDQLCSLWGNSFNHRMQVAAGYFNSLPEADRAYFETQVCRGGIILGDTVEAIKYMYEQGVAQAKPVVKVDNLAGEIEAIENIMRTDRARYNRDIALQERLRLLYELRN